MKTYPSQPTQRQELRLPATWPALPSPVVEKSSAHLTTHIHAAVLSEKQKQKHLSSASDWEMQAATAGNAAGASISWKGENKQTPDNSYTCCCEHMLSAQAKAKGMHPLQPTTKFEVPLPATLPALSSPVKGKTNRHLTTHIHAVMTAWFLHKQEEKHASSAASG